MVSGALVCFRMGTTISSKWETPLTVLISEFLAYQMPECQASRFFRLFAATPRLDKLVAGIPNAINIWEDAYVK
jgi:hypothetical protein